MGLVNKMKPFRNKIIPGRLSQVIVRSLAVVLIFLFFNQEAQAVKRRQITTLSNNVKHSSLLSVSGVPVSCLIGNRRSSGTFITKVVKGGPGYRSGIKAGDVILSINNKIMVNARQLDTAIQGLSGSTARVKLARKYGGQLKLKQFNANWSAYATRKSQVSNQKIVPAPRKKISKSTTSIAELESYFFNLINQDRKREAGLPPYRLDSNLSKLARTYANDQSKRGFTGHRDPEGRMPRDRARMMGISTPVSENVAWSSGESLSLKQKVKYCQDNMMNEPPNQANHRGAILSTVYQYVGVGVAVDSKGKVNVVQEFSSQPAR